MADLICVKTYLNKHEAELAKGFLESQGIEAMVSSDDCGGARPSMTFLTGAKLLVKESDRDKALGVLDDKS